MRTPPPRTAVTGPSRGAGCTPSAPGPPAGRTDLAHAAPVCLPVITGCPYDTVYQIISSGISSRGEPRRATLKVFREGFARPEEETPMVEPASPSAPVSRRALLGSVIGAAALTAGIAVEPTAASATQLDGTWKVNANGYIGDLGKSCDKEAAEPVLRHPPCSESRWWVPARRCSGPS